jgi:hypothetical protein
MFITISSPTQGIIKKSRPGREYQKESPTFHSQIKLYPCQAMASWLALPPDEEVGCNKLTHIHIYEIAEK